MLDLLELEQFIAYADCGTLSKAAEKLHISQPTITRSMQHVEDAFGVLLFTRGKNRITLNRTGEKAVHCVRTLLEAEKDTLRQVQAFDKSLHTITVESCAPAPLWSLLPILSSSCPDMTISSGIKEIDSIIEHVTLGSCKLGILPYYAELDKITCVPILKEALSLCVRPTHDLASKKSLTFSDMNGFNFLLRSEIGFWDSLCREKMPASKFLVQTDDFSFNELIQESSLPFFITNISNNTNKYLQDRIVLPITSPEAAVTYHMIFQENQKEFYLVFLSLHAIMGVDNSNKPESKGLYPRLPVTKG